MRSSPARVILRYRPGSDILHSRVEHPSFAGAATLRDEADADTVVEWYEMPGEPGTSLGPRLVLAGFQMVHASDRWAGAGPRDLPAALETPVRDLVGAARAAIGVRSTVAERVQARAETIIEVELASLERPATAPGFLGALGAAEALAESIADALADIARAVDALPASWVSSAVDDLDDRLGELIALLGELSTTVRRTARPARGTMLATARAIRGGVPMTTSERYRLRSALALLDDPATWPLARQELRSVSDELTRTSLGGRP
jgi:hypothetical protein